TLAVQISHALQNARKELAELVIAICAERRSSAELVGEVAGHVLQMVTECGGGGLDLPLPERSRDFVPNLLVRLDQRTRVDCPAMESDGCFGGDKTGRLHLL